MFGDEVAVSEEIDFKQFEIDRAKNRAREVEAHINAFNNLYNADEVNQLLISKQKEFNDIIKKLHKARSEACEFNEDVRGIDDCISEMTSKKQEFITNLEKDSKIAIEAVKETSAMLIQKLVKSYLSKNTFTELDHGTKLPKLFSLFNRIKAQIYRGKILQLDELIHAKTKEKNILNSRLAKLIKKIVITDQEIEKASKKGSSDGTISIESAEYISKILKPHIDKYFKNGRHLEAIIESCKTQGLDHIDILKIIRDCSQLKEEFNKNKTLENYESLIEAKKNFLNMTNLNTMMIDLNKEIDIIEQQLEELAKYSLYQQLGLMETNGFKEFTTSEKFTAFINTSINRAREKEKIDKELAINRFY